MKYVLNVFLFEIIQTCFRKSLALNWCHNKKRGRYDLYLRLTLGLVSVCQIDLLIISSLNDRDQCD